MASFNVENDLISLVKEGMAKTHKSQVELAEVSGVSLKHVNGVLNGKAKASIPLWQRLVDAAWKKTETHTDGKQLRPQ